MNNDNNEIYEINSDTAEMLFTNNEENNLNNNSNNNNLKNKKNLKDLWNDLDNQKKTIIIVSIVVVVLLIGGIIFYFSFFKKDLGENKEEEKKEEEVIILKDNYRYQNGNLVFLDKLDRELGSYECVNKDPDNCLLAKSNFESDSFNRVILAYENGEEIIASSPIYFDNYTFVKDGDKIILYDFKRQENLLELSDIKIYDTGSNLAVIKDTNNKYGLITIREDGFLYLVKCIYDNLGIINNELGYLVAEEGSSKYIIDCNGKKISANIVGDAKSVSEDYLITMENNKYKLSTLNGKEIASNYDYIEIHDEVISFVKDNSLYLENLDLIKLNEEGINLTNNNYVKKYIYTTDNKLKETRVAYEIKVTNDMVNITIDKENFNINMLEGIVSNNYNYLSYYDGVLYFYNDNDKNNLIGTYKCTNKNSLTSSNDTLNKCMIYQNDNGLSSIYNNNYVFIQDGNDNLIYLYDLKNAKTLGTYDEINIINNNEINDKINLVNTELSYILAKSAIGNNKGYYGILEITKEKAQGKVEFKYESITKKNDYYLMISKDKVYSVFNSNFDRVSNEFAYLEMYDNYYVGIIDSKLNVYAYDNALGILPESLNVTNNEYKIDFTDGFNITINDVTYKYDLEGNLYEE